MQSDVTKKAHNLKTKGRGNAKASSPSKSDHPARSAHGQRGYQAKKSLPSGSRANQSNAASDSNPDDLLAAYFEKQKAKEVSKNTVQVLAIDQAEEMLKAVGRKKPPSPILEDEGAEEEEEENRAEGGGSSRPSLDWTLGRVLGSRQSTTSSIPETLSRPEFVLGRMSPDSSTMRATTPSVSIIENESVWSASSPAPSLGRGLNSPLPTLSEIPLASSPIPTFDSIIEDGLEQGTKTGSSERTSLSSAQQKKATGNVPNRGEKFEKSPKDKEMRVRGKDHLSTISLSSISVVAESMATSSHKRDQQISKDLSSLQTEEELTRVAMSESTSNDPNEARLESSASNEVFDTRAKIEVEEEDCDSSSGDEADGRFEGKMRNSLKTIPSPVQKIDIVRRPSGSEVSLSTVAQSSVTNTIPEDDETVEINGENPEESHHRLLSGFDDGLIGSNLNNEGLLDSKDGSDVESSERTWDSDFDASFLGSVGEISSTLSASDEERRANSRGGGSASSSSNNTEQLMKVRIRRKQLSHHRQRRPDRFAQAHSPSVSSPRDPSMALRRMLSQSDALTVQRNAQIGRTRFERKRAKSAVENGSGHQHGKASIGSTGAEKREHINQCVLCAAEGSGHHAEHAKPKSPATPAGEGATEKERRRISFKDEAKQGVSRKPSPRLPRSGRSSVNQQSPRELLSRQSSVTQPSPRDSGSRRSSITQPSPRSALGHRSPAGKNVSRQQSQEERDRLSQTPDAASKDYLWSCGAQTMLLWSLSHRCLTHHDTDTY